MSCGDCDKVVIDKLQMIKQVLEALRQGHNALAGLYREIATGLQESERKVYMDAAEHQQWLAKESEKMVVPIGAESALGFDAGNKATKLMG